MAQHKATPPALPLIDRVHAAVLQPLQRPGLLADLAAEAWAAYCEQDDAICAAFNALQAELQAMPGGAPKLQQWLDRLGESTAAQDLAASAYMQAMEAERRHLAAPRTVAQQRRRIGRPASPGARL